MLDLHRPALAAGLLWVLACIAWLAFAARKASAHRAAPSHGYRGRYPGLLLNGIGLVALTPVVSAVQYVASSHQYFWGGAWVLGIGVFMIACHFRLARRPADWVARPAITTSREMNAYRVLAAGVWCVTLLVIAGKPSGLTFCALMGTFAVAELARLGSELYAYRFGA